MPSKQNRHFHLSVSFIFNGKQIDLWSIFQTGETQNETENHLVNWKFAFNVIQFYFDLFHSFSGAEREN